MTKDKLLAKTMVRFAAIFTTGIVALLFIGWAQAQGDTATEASGVEWFIQELPGNAIDEPAVYTCPSGDTCWKLTDVSGEWDCKPGHYLTRKNGELFCEQVIHRECKVEWYVDLPNERPWWGFACGKEGDANCLCTFVIHEDTEGRGPTPP